MMIAESLFKNLKHHDLAEFNRPCLDLVVDVIISNVLPRMQQTLDYVRGMCRKGRPSALARWQVDFKVARMDMSKTDEQRVVEKQLKWLRKPAKTKGRTERLAELDEEEQRPQGTYKTNIKQWTCSCPSYLISHFLLCKHLVRATNIALQDEPLTSLAFLHKLRRNHYPPYYSIPVRGHWQ
jgi:hypothetical protein